ncbi:MAG: methylated-DNA--[protein]-cysteine S-methyltransferase [Bryobacterales bacterium]|nr:methylated-DNA--[protein]-cysteine S-methyltransferase [Bryobacteraceae bacterium]MDW8353962.1 methylated-DNA--[protein]-cysteine S-methyltransferase [Bryobacterales bacterium]
MEQWICFSPSPGLILRVAATSRGVSRILLLDSGRAGRHAAAARPQTSSGDASPELLRAVRGQLLEYFRGKRRAFDLPLELRGTPFQRRVWQELTRIPYGATRSYGEIARAIGEPGAARAVGQACGANPVPIVVPCHRVIAAHGGLGGYGGGLRLKRFLLELEQASLSGHPLGRRARAG